MGMSPTVLCPFSVLYGLFRAAAKKRGGADALHPVFREFFRYCSGVTP